MSRPERLKPIDKLAAAVTELMKSTGMPAAARVGQPRATSGFYTVVHRSTVEVYYIDMLHPRSARPQWQDAFVEQMGPLLAKQFGANRVQRKDFRDRKGFAVSLT